MSNQKTARSGETLAAVAKVVLILAAGGLYANWRAGSRGLPATAPEERSLGVQDAAAGCERVAELVRRAPDPAGSKGAALVLAEAARVESHAAELARNEYERTRLAAALHALRAERDRLSSEGGLRLAVNRYIVACEKALAGY